MSGPKSETPAIQRFEERVAAICFGWPGCYLWPIWMLPLFLWVVLDPRGRRKSWDRP